MKTKIEGDVFVAVIDVIWVSNTGGIVELFATKPSVANGIENELYCNLHMVNTGLNSRYMVLHKAQKGQEFLFILKISPFFNQPTHSID